MDVEKFLGAIGIILTPVMIVFVIAVYTGVIAF